MYRYFYSMLAVLQEGREPLPHCSKCGMKFPECRMPKHQRTARYDNNEYMRCRRRDVAISGRCVGSSFSLTGEDGAECIDGVGVFTYLGKSL